MAYEKTLWKNRLVEKPRTFRFQQNANGSVTLNPEEGQIIEPGTPINAGNLNKIEDALEVHGSQLDDITRFETAGGTATAITLTLPTLTNGYAKTFIASANNGGAATTINTKPLYKPGTTTAPTLIAGKAYTVWYNTTGNCFFIKASATGTATTAQVLATVPFSNENDTDLIGTMPNRAGVVTGQSATYTGTYVRIQPLEGYYGGAVGNYVQFSDPNFVAANFLATKNIFGLQGSIPVQGVVAAAAQDVSGTTIRLRPPAGYYDGTSSALVTVTDADFVASNILSGVNIFGLAGTLVQGKKFASGSVTGSTVSVSGLGFTPSVIIIQSSDNTTRKVYNGVTLLDQVEYKYSSVPGNQSGWTVSAGSFSTNMMANTTWNWKAYE